MGGIASKELLVAQGEVKVLLSQLKQSANALSAAKRELAAAQHGASQQRGAAESAELEEARRKLELLSGELKVGEQERLAVERLRGELKGARAAADDERREKERLNAQVIAAANQRLRPEEHPIFGALLHDHGFKRVYRASPLTVWAATPIWEKQRAFRTDRAEAIAAAKSLGRVEGWPGTISVCEILDGGGARTSGAGTGGSPDEAGGGAGPEGSDAAASCFVIDGQHRLGAAHLLAKKGGLSASLEAITLEFYPQVRKGPSAPPAGQRRAGTAHLRAAASAQPAALPPEPPRCAPPPRASLRAGEHIGRAGPLHRDQQGAARQARRPARRGRLAGRERHPHRRRDGAPHVRARRARRTRRTRRAARVRAAAPPERGACPSRRAAPSLPPPGAACTRRCSRPRPTAGRRT